MHVQEHMNTNVCISGHAHRHTRAATPWEMQALVRTSTHQGTLARFQLECAPPAYHVLSGVNVSQGMQRRGKRYRSMNPRAGVARERGQKQGPCL